MAVKYKICVDCTDPHRLAACWAEAMGHTVDDDSQLIEQLPEQGRIDHALVTASLDRTAHDNVAARLNAEACTVHHSRLIEQRLECPARR